jgi:hypothetical protein
MAYGGGKPIVLDWYRQPIFSVPGGSVCLRRLFAAGCPFVGNRSYKTLISETRKTAKWKFLKIRFGGAQDLRASRRPCLLRLLKVTRRAYRGGKGPGHGPATYRITL